MNRIACLVLLFSGLAPMPARGKVYLRVSGAALPSAEALGVREIVVPWPLREGAILETAGARGFRVFFEAAPGDLAAASEAADRAKAGGLFVDAGQDGPEGARAAIARAERAHPRLSYRLVDPGGKEPQMKGRLVVDRDGILQVSSPTSQPWVDSNLALVRIARAFHPESVPLYTFSWELSDPMRKSLGPAAEDYALAIQEATAFRADLVLDLYGRLEAGLAGRDSAAWALWNRVKPYLRSASVPWRRLEPLARTGVVADDDQASYEGINLMARHNLAFRVLRPSDVESRGLEGLDALVVFRAPAQASLLAEFAKRGGVVVLVNLQGPFPWHAAEPARSDGHSAAYAVGSGQIVELREPVIDPEAFAREVRQVLGAERAPLSLWNSLTTVAVGYVDRESGETLLDLVNYALEPEPVQVQVRGRFSSIRYESPEDGCCRPLPGSERAGMTEFVVPALFIGGTVHLKGAER